MYKIVYTKEAAKDIPKLKSAHLDGKAKALIALIKDLVRQGAVTEEIYKLYDVITDVSDGTVEPILKSIAG